MYALRERRVHVTQEDFELAVAKVNKIVINMKRLGNMSNSDFFEILYQSLKKLKNVFFLTFLTNLPISCYIF